MKCLPLRHSMPWNVYALGIPRHEMSTPWEFHTMNVYPWGIPRHKMSTSEKFHAIKCLPLRNSILMSRPEEFLEDSKLIQPYPGGIPMLILLYPWGIPCSFDPTPEEFQAHFTLPLRNSMLILLYPWGIHFNIVNNQSTLGLPWVNPGQKHG